jgi:hypothetical protein
LIFPTDTGCEVYEGEADVIGAAVAAGDWQALRNGTAAHSFVGFPKFIVGEYFDWLAGALASVLAQPVVQIHHLRMVAGEDGHWSADVLPPDWVAALASVPAKHIWWLTRQWTEVYLREKDPEQEPWREDELLEPLYRLTVLCQEAVARHSDVVLLTI